MAAVTSIVVLAGGGYWIYERSHTVSIDDARIASNVIAISSNRAGWLDEFPVKSGQRVDADTLLAKLDVRGASLALKELDSQIVRQQALIEQAQSEREIAEQQFTSEVAAQQARVASVQANLAQMGSELEQARNNHQRATALRDKSLLSKNAWEESRLRMQIAEQHQLGAKAALEEARSRLSKANAALQTVTVLEQKVSILQQDLARLNVKRQQQQLDLDDRHIHSPIGAVIDKTFVHAGEYVNPGRRILMLHDPNDIWIDANIKETDVRKVKPGMIARVTVDAYPDQVFQAVVDRVDHATTSEFALMPNPNPSGNFTKVTQRLRVVLDIEQRENLLKPGMMVSVDIDTDAKIGADIETNSQVVKETAATTKTRVDS